MKTKDKMKETKQTQFFSMLTIYTVFEIEMYKATSQYSKSQSR